MNKLQLKSKLLLLSILPVFVIMSVAIGIIVTLENKAVEEEVTLYKERLIHERKSQLKDATTIAQHAVDGVIANNTNPSVALEKIRALLTPLDLQTIAQVTFFYLRYERYQPGACNGSCQS